MNARRVSMLCFCTLGFSLLLFYSRSALQGTVEGIQLCLQTVIPTLFPFVFFSIVLTSALSGIHLPLLTGIARLFRVNESLSGILVPSFLGGYPVGAQGAAAWYKQGLLSKDAAERMLSFCNQAGPAFLFGIVGPQFTQSETAWVLWIILIAGALLSSRVLNRQIEFRVKPKENDLSFPDALKQAISALANICGWIILCRLFISVCKDLLFSKLPIWMQVMLCGVLELSNGCCMLSMISDESIRFLIAGILLSIGGFCIWMQTASVTSGLNLRYYLCGKIIQTAFVIAAEIAYLNKIWWFIPIALAIFLLIPGNGKKEVAFLQKLVYNGTELRRDPACFFEKK